MKLFKSKAEKEQERKLLVKKSMRELEKRIVKLREQEAFYINAAKEAVREELPDQVKLAEEALKMTVSERKRTYKMYLNAKIASQMKDMASMTNEFLNAMRVISKDMAAGTTADMAKVTSELEFAMGKVADQTENLAELLEQSQGDVSNFSTSSALVSDDEIQKMIYGDPSASAATDIDAEIAAMAKRLDE